MKRKYSRSKYNAKKTKVDEITFDSKKEAKRYQELKLLQKAKHISDLILQPVFELLPTQKYKGETLRKLTYKADFQYTDNLSGDKVVEDVKGFKTAVYTIKKKLFIDKYGDDYDFREV